MLSRCYDVLLLLRAAGPGREPRFRKTASTPREHSSCSRSSTRSGQRRACLRWKPTSGWRARHASTRNAWPKTDSLQHQFDGRAAAVAAVERRECALRPRWRKYRSRQRCGQCARHADAVAAASRQHPQPAIQCGRDRNRARRRPGLCDGRFRPRPAELLGTGSRCRRTAGHQ